MKNLFSLCVIVILGALGVLTFQAVMRPEPGAGATRRGNGQAGGIPVEVASVTTTDLIDEGTFTGSLLPIAQFTVAPKVAGRLKRLFVDVGDTVKSGQVIAELEDEEFVQAVTQAEAETAIARANVADSQAQLDIGRRELERVKAMRMQKVSSQAEVETAQAQYDSRAARHEVNKAQVTLKES
ncbi:MAG TPA: biotin/lipoyl-binding protein, partial [Candidatus Ozemobacteraceae bacterium]|nr:biotin/lipoyl-binding protein [Candidatus Ozemobacteraceae bacterium]